MWRNAYDVVRGGAPGGVFVNDSAGWEAVNISSVNRHAKESDLDDTAL